MSFDRGYYQLGNVASRQVSQRDLSSQSRLKLRRNAGDTQAREQSVEERLQRLKNELQEREGALPPPKLAPVEATTTTNLQEFDDADDEDLQKEEDAAPAPPAASAAEKKTAEPESELEMELKREMERVKAEKRLRLEEEEEVKPKSGPALLLNPLLGNTNGLARRWDDDVIFRNQARGEVDTQKNKRLINDTTKSDVHRDFLKRHIM